MADSSNFLISPGAFSRFFDLSVRPAAPVGAGAALVGPRRKGPAFSPVFLKDRDADEQMFGLPTSDGKDFSAYASRAYLENETSPLTMVRVLGMDDTGIVPGYSLGSAAAAGLYAIAGSGSNIVALIAASGAVSLVGTQSSSVDSLGITIAGYNSDVAVTASLNRNSAQYLKKVLNTDPTQYSTQKHFVFAVYDFADKTPRSHNAFVAFKVPSSNLFQDSFLTGATTQIISQPFSTTEYGLFGVGSIFAGDSSNTEFKVSVQNIKKSPVPAIDEYGTFTLVVRAFGDNDKSPVVLESFSNLTLNPDSVNYVARRIGDKYKVWNKSTKKFDEFGDYENQSKYIYVLPSTDLKNKNVPATALPWGFSGYRTHTSGAISPAATPNLALMPQLPLVNNLIYKNDFSTKVYWGVAAIDNASGSINQGVPDRIKHLPKMLLSSSTAGQSFSLKWISGAIQNASGYTSAVRLTDAMIAALTTSITMNTGTAVPAPSSSAGYSGYLSVENLENTNLAKFTVVMNDGFDATDITLANTFDPANMSTTTTYQTYAYRAALDMLSNPDEHDLTDLAMPGVWAAKVTDYAIDMVENRGDVFYAMDVSGSTVSDVIDNVSTRQLDTSYAACYYPWVQYNDKINDKLVSVPPTVVIPATFGYSDSVSFPWYAPAGLSRGGLRKHGVVKALDKLTATDRDNLYANRINPISSFPSSGPVVWGQKTLQQASSALDRINVQRMILTLRKLVKAKAIRVVFEPNVPAVWDRFVNDITPDLARIQQNFGIQEFKLILDESTTTEDMVERNIMYAKIAIKPTRASEFILVDFFISNNAVGFSE